MPQTKKLVTLKVVHHDHSYYSDDELFFLSVLLTQRRCMICCKKYLQLYCSFLYHSFLPDSCMSCFEPHNSQVQNAGATNFSSSLCVQTSSEALDTGGEFRVVKRSHGVTLTTHSLLVPRSRMSRSYTFCTTWFLHNGNGTSF
jgi:hypothetical protein